ncbi:MAG: GyrI-like domain-containing protein [Bacillota bacterium]
MVLNTGIKSMPEEYVAYLLKRGDYSLMADAFEELRKWVDENDFGPGGPPVIVYLTSPVGTPPSIREWEIRIPVRGNRYAVAGECGPGVKKVPAREVVFTTNVGGYTTVEDVLPALFQELYDKNCRLAGPAEEVYPADFAGMPVEEVVTEVRFPVVPRSRRDS